MPNYLARVVLHRLNSKGNDSSEDYQDFHDLMEKIGFVPLINGGSNTVYALPGGMYYFDDDSAANQARTYKLEDAYNAVNVAVTAVLKDESKYIRDVNNPHSVFLAEVPRSMWSGLKPIPAVVPLVFKRSKPNPFR